MKFLLLPLVLTTLLAFATCTPAPKKSAPFLRTVARTRRFTPQVQPTRLLPVPTIFGGVEADIELERRTARLSICFEAECGFSCTASILNRRTLLTAAHCVYNNGRFASAVQVITGGFTYNTRSVHVHRDYIAAADSGEEFAHDVAVLRTRRRLRGKGRDIKFKLTTKMKQIPREFQPVKVAGNGLTEAGGTPSPQLMVGEATRLPDAQCQGYDARGFLCTDTRRASGVLCRGDSGGPMFVKLKNGYRLVGVNSAVLLETVENAEVQPFTCGDSNTVHIYTNVQSYFNHIRSCFKTCSGIWTNVRF